MLFLLCPVILENTRDTHPTDLQLRVIYKLHVFHNTRDRRCIVPQGYGASLRYAPNPCLPARLVGVPVFGEAVYSLKAFGLLNEEFIIISWNITMKILL